VWAAAAVLCEAAVIRPLFGDWPGPDLVVIVLLGRVRATPSARAALVGGLAGVARDLVATTCPGTYALAYLVVGLVAAELDQLVRLSGPVLAAALAVLAHVVASAIACVAEAGVPLELGPGLALGTAVATALVALVAGIGAVAPERP